MPVLLLALQVLALPTDGPALSHAVEPLRDAVIGVCGPHVDVPRDELLDREARLARNSPTDPDSLRALACLRGVLAGEGLRAREGYLMPLGESWRSGSVAALATLLERTPDDAEALRLLSAILLDEPLADEARRWAKIVARGVSLGARDPAVIRACAAVLTRVRAYTEARRCAEHGLRLGHDSTTHLLILAHERFAAHDSVNGAWAFRNAAAVARTPRALAEVTWHLAWFLSPAERTAWDTLPDHQRADWLTEQLAVRDVRDGRQQHARLAEHFARLEHVMTHFSMQVTPMMRRRMLSGTSISDQVGSQTRVEVEPVDAELGRSLDFRTYRRWQVDFDDRGVVWMRFGAPMEKTVYYVPIAGVLGPGDYRAFEAWKYRIDDETLILTFESEEGDGSGEPTRLVTGMYGEFYCGFDIYRCTLANRAQSAAAFNRLAGRRSDAGRVGITPAQLGTLREADHERIVEATTKDDNSVRVAHHVATTAQYLRVWEPGTGRPIALMPYAVRAGDLATTRLDDRRAAVFEVTARAYDRERNAWFDSTAVRRLRLADRTDDDARLTGLMVVPRTEAVTAWSVVVAQDSTRRGRAFGGALAPIEGSALVLSDLVLGASRQGLTWEAGGEPVTLAPLGTFRRDEPVEVFLQVKAHAAQPRARASFALYRITNGVRSVNPALELGFALPVGAGLTDIRRALDVRELEEGAYYLRVRVTSGMLHAVQGSHLELRR